MRSILIRIAVLLFRVILFNLATNLLSESTTDFLRATR
jgi:hypothetical protein